MNNSTYLVKWLNGDRQLILNLEQYDYPMANLFDYLDEQGDPNGVKFLEITDEEIVNLNDDNFWEDYVCTPEEIEDAGEDYSRIWKDFSKEWEKEAKDRIALEGGVSPLEAMVMS
jgi:hypothetical protein|tara:strand:- start:1388 stop:1732 length:345 start_codon:yes stop_codon:yes gene_type:complete